MTEQTETVEEVEVNYEDPVEKFQTFGNLEKSKQAFFNKKYDTFESELAKIPCKFFEATYKFSSDMDGKPSFIASNLNSGLVKELDDMRKYFLVVFRCVKTDTGYTYTSMWISNTPDVQCIYKSRYDDFEWTDVSSDAPADFLARFRPTDGEVVSEKYVH
jgi:hypothetical protein